MTRTFSTWRRWFFHLHKIWYATATLPKFTYACSYRLFAAPWSVLHLHILQSQQFCWLLVIYNSFNILFRTRFMLLPFVMSHIVHRYVTDVILTYSQDLLMTQILSKFSRATNLIEILIWHFSVTFTSSSFLRWNPSLSVRLGISLVLSKSFSLNSATTRQ